MENYIEIKRTLIKESVQEIADLFEPNNIEFIIEDTRPSFDVTFSNSGIVEYILKVKSSDYDRANELLVNNIKENYETEEHYLDSFQNDDLIDVISIPENWDITDVEYAKKLLKKRGIKVDQEIIEKSILKQEKELIEPTKAKISIILVGYLFSLLGGWIGLAIGLHLKYKKKEIEGKENVFFYDETSRSHGDWMLLLAIIWILIWLIYLSV